MKILQINKYHYHRGGADNYFFDVTDLLREHGHDVVSFSMRDERNLPSDQSSFFIDGVDFRRPASLWKKIQLFPRFFWSPEASRKLTAMIQQEKPDLAHIHNFSHHLTSSILFTLRRHHIPIVVTLHDYKLICPTSFLYDGKLPSEHCKRHRYYQCVWHRCIQGSFIGSMIMALESTFNWFLGTYQRTIDVAIAPSLFLRQKFFDFGSRLSIVHVSNFIPLASLPQPLDEHNATQETILFVGRLSREKGVSTLLEVARLLPERRFEVIGDGQEREWLQEHATSNVFFRGSLSRKETWEAIRQARCLVVPSEWYENAPLVIMEAMALGTVVVASRIGGIPELIEDGVSGVLFEPANAHDLAEKIQHVFSDTHWRTSLEHAAGEKAQKHYNSENHYTALMEVYAVAMKQKDSSLR